VIDELVRAAVRTRQLRHGGESRSTLQSEPGNRLNRRLRPAADAGRQNPPEGKRSRYLTVQFRVEIHDRLLAFGAGVVPGQRGKPRKSRHLIPIQLGRAVEAMHSWKRIQLHDDIIVTDVAEALAEA